MKQIFTTYSTTTPESVANGDTSDNGWYKNGWKSKPLDKPDSGHSCEPKGTDDSPVSSAIRYLKDNGVIEGSSSHFHPGVWFISESQVEDYGTGERIEYSFHLEGFTDSEQLEIFNGVLK